MQYKILPGHLYPKDNRINLYYFHNLLKVIGDSVSQQLKQQHKISVPITAGMWGGSYMVAQDDGQARTNVVRLYSIVNLPQNSPLNSVENFECLMEIYQQTLCTTFMLLFQGSGKQCRPHHRWPVFRRNLWNRYWPYCAGGSTGRNAGPHQG